MFKEMLIKAAVENFAKKELNPLEKLLQPQEKEVFAAKKEVKGKNIFEVTIEDIKELAKNYFYGIGNIEMAEAVDSLNPKVRSKALVEAGEKCPELGRMMKEHDDKLIREINEEIDEIMSGLKAKFPEIT
ncbi:MAG: hypothetical protein IKJ88_07755 [Clostridia bacterium]|nr:hypothetical protein [Clostridia bacterium]